MKSIKEFRPIYSEHGVTVAKDLFERDELYRFEEVFFRRLLCQAYKMGIVDSITEPYNAEGLDRIVMAVNAKSKIALDFVVQELREVFSAAKLLTNGRLQSVFSEVLDCPPDLMKVHMDGILVNLPQNKTRLYKYHAEQHYYPFRRNFTMLWMPVVREKTVENGAMLLKISAHKKNYGFNEYTGFTEVVNHLVDESQAFHQLELIDDEIQEFETVACDVGCNQGIIFHQNTPHTSQVNLSTTPSYALIIRCYDYRRDPTLSDRTGVKAYTNDAARGGYPGIRPIPV